MEVQQKKNTTKTAIVILAVLLGVSVIALVGLLLYQRFAQADPATVAVPDNIIAAEESTLEDASSNRSDLAAPGPDAVGTVASGTAVTAQKEAQLLQLYSGHADENVPFAADNLLPGDSVTQYYAVQIHHTKELALLFRADVTEETKALGNVLHIRVKNLETGAVLCDGMFSEIDGREFSQTFAAAQDGESMAYYEITVSLDTSVGNEYQAARLLADFHWYAPEEEDLGDAPQTGDALALFLGTVAAISAIGLILLVLYRRRKEAEIDDR